MTERDHIESFFMKETLDTMSRSHKVAYKYCLGAIFINLIVGGGQIRGQEENYVIAERVKELPRKKTNFDRLTEDISAKVHDSMEKNHFVKPYDTVILDKIINFTRLRLREIKNKNSSLFQASELSGIIDLKAFFGFQSVEQHHWIDFDVRSGLVLTLPEAIVFHDLKVHWNDFIGLASILMEEQSRLTNHQERFAYFNSEPTREKLYKRAAAARALIFLCVSFVESYLLNLFYTIKESAVPGKEFAAGMLAQTKIEDEMIVEAVIYRIFPEFKAAMDDMFRIYKVTNNFRNRYVHASPFMDASTNISYLQPLLSVDDDLVIDSLQNSLDFVQKLDSLLPENLKLLFWWYDDEVIIFKQMQPLKLTNSYSRYNRMSYMKR